MRPPVVAIIPARDEAALIEDTVRGLRTIPEVARVIVVDDGSADDTAPRARRAGAEVHRMVRSVGKGRALETGIGRCGDAAIFVFADGDLGGSAAGLREVLRSVTEHGADLAIAVLPPHRGGFGLVRRMAGWAIRRATGRTMAAPLSGQRVLTARALALCRPLAPGFGVEVAMTIDALRAGLDVREVPADLRHRPPGRDLAGFLHRARQGRDILRAIVARRGPS